MPVQTGRDNQGCFAKWGEEGKKYYYTCGSKISRTRAKAKARTQGLAIGEYTFTEQTVKLFNFISDDNRES